MATSRPFAYNTGPNITGATQVGNIAIGVDSHPYNENWGGVRWWNGPDEDLGYVIARTQALANQPNPDGASASIRFFRSKLKTEQSYLELVERQFGQSFATGSNAKEWLENNGFWSSYGGSTLGTFDNPGVSAQDIYDSGQTISDWYYIQTSSMNTPRLVYCNMEDEGGGWMLITYNPTNTVTAGNAYPNNWSYINGSFSSKFCADVRNLWYHNGIHQCTQVMKMASTTASLVPKLINFQIANKVVYNNPSNLKLSATFSATQSAVYQNNTPMGGSWSAIKGHTLMTGPLNVNAPGDWIYLAANQWWTVCGPSTAYPDSQGRSGNAQGSGSWTNISSSNIYGMANVASNTNSNRTDIKTYAVYIK